MSEPGKGAPGAATPTPEQLAALALGLEPGTALDRARPAILRLLAAGSVMPDERTHNAIALVCGRPIPAESGLHADVFRMESQRLRHEVEQFLTQFFTLRPPERSARWRELVEACAGHDLLLDHLRALRPGLLAEPLEVRDRTEVQMLAALIAKTFVLPPGARRLKSQSEARRLRSGTWREAIAWSNAASRLRRRFPTVALLEPELIAALSAPRKRRPKAPRQPTTEQEGRWGLLVAVLIGCAALGRLGSEQSPQGPPHQSQPLSPAAAPFPVVGTAQLDLFRYIARQALKQELDRKHKSLTDQQIDKVVSELPDAAFVSVGSLDGRAVQAREMVIDALARSLAREGVQLDRSELEEIVSKRFVRRGGPIAKDKDSEREKARDAHTEQENEKEEPVPSGTDEPRTDLLGPGETEGPQLPHGRP
jgi:hypothetical protein